MPGRRRDEGRVFRLAALLLLMLGAWLPDAAVAQVQPGPLRQTVILTIEPERLYSGSQFGQRVARELEAEGAVLAAENRSIEASLTAEERELSEQRKEMEPEAFRALADAFDEKVERIRREQDAKALALAQKNDAERVAFLRAARPVLERLMLDTGAAIILERSSVFLSADTTDVTTLAIRRIDATIGDGSGDETTDDTTDMPQDR